MMDKMDKRQVMQQRAMSDKFDVVNDLVADEYSNYMEEGGDINKCLKSLAMKIKMLAMTKEEDGMDEEMM